MAEIPEFISIERITEMHEYLITNPDLLLKPYLERRGLTIGTIMKYKIGFDYVQDRYIIPIPDEMANWITARAYSLNPKGDEPKIRAWKAGYLGVALYPIAQLVALESGALVLICEGEHDALMAIQQGYRAVAGTAGAGTWKPEWNDWFAGVQTDIVVIYDPDVAGQKGAKKVMRELSPYARTIRSVLLPDGDDLTDFFKRGRTADELDKIIRETPLEDQYSPIDITTGVDGERVGHKLRWTANIVGKDLSPYLVPKRISATCSSKSKSHRCCNNCSLEETKEIRKELTWEDIENLVKCVGSGDDTVTSILRKMVGIVPGTMCRLSRINIDERQTIENVTLIPEVDYAKEDAKYSLRNAYFLGKDLETNTGYSFKGTVLPSSESQQAIMVVQEAISVKDKVSRWHLTSDVADELKRVFQPEEESINAYARKIGEISQDLSSHVTKIYGRDYLILSILLTMHSVLSFELLGTMLTKGWIELCIVGDTETGKTETVKNLIYHARAGEFLTSGENATLAGILGGLQNSASGQWTVTWGKIPFNDRGLVAMDEMENLAKEGIIAKLSGVRTSGIAELIKVQTQRTMARTRIIWIANPLSGRMASYPFAVESVMELFKEQQDVRRIDFVIGCRKEEITDEEINRRREIGVKQVFTSDILHNSVMRAWNIRPEAVFFEKEAEDLILKCATEMGAKYSPEMPLLLGTGGRNKISRLAVALATMLYSTTDGSDVIVKESHVDYVTKFLARLYDTSVLGFFDYSQTKRRKNVFHENEYIKGLFSTVQRCEDFLSSTGLRREDFEEIFNKGKDEARVVVSNLREAGAITKKYQYYNKSPHFVEWLRDRIKLLREAQRDLTDFDVEEYKHQMEAEQTIVGGGDE